MRNNDVENNGIYSDEILWSSNNNVQKVKRKNENKKSTTIIGDSLLKNIVPYKMRKSLPNERLFKKSFPGATLDDMMD